MMKHPLQDDPLGYAVLRGLIACVYAFAICYAADHLRDLVKVEQNYADNMVQGTNMRVETIPESINPTIGMCIGCDANKMDLPSIVKAKP